MDLLRMAIRDGVVPPAESMEQDEFEEAMAKATVDLYLTGRTVLADGTVVEMTWED